MITIGPPDAAAVLPQRIQCRQMSRIKVLQRRAWRTQSVGDHLDRAASGGLPKVMGLVELTFLGLGSIIGAGVFVLSGVTAREVAGPAVVLSYVVAATAALLAGLSYAGAHVSWHCMAHPLDLLFFLFSSSTRVLPRGLQRAQ